MFTINLPPHELAYLIPELVMAIGLLFVFTLTIMEYKKTTQDTMVIALVGLLTPVVALVFWGLKLNEYMAAHPSLLSTFSGAAEALVKPSSSEPMTILYNTLSVDCLAFFGRGLLLLGSAILLAFTQPYLSKQTYVVGDFYALVLGATLGGMLLVAANDFILLFVALETLSITSYILAGYLRKTYTSAEAGFKYLVYGGAASGVLLFAISLLYGLSGSTLFNQTAAALQATQAMGHPMMILIAVMILAALAFKLSLAPFHMWTPDVYEGAPTPVAAFLSVVSKTAAFMVTIRLLTMVLGGIPYWQPLLAVVCVLSMVIGNITAIRQTSLKRLLAYSTIAQAGYMTLGLLVHSAFGIAGILFYLLTYLFMNMGAFAAVVAINHELGTDDIGALSGLIQKRPSIVLGLSICLLSLAGIPITAGFFAKFFLFQSVIAQSAHLMPFIIVALVTSVVSMVYYLKPIRLMVLGSPSSQVDSLLVEKDAPFALTAMVIATIMLGVFATPFFNFGQVAAGQLLSASPFNQTEPHPAQAETPVVPPTPAAAIR